MPNDPSFVNASANSSVSLPTQGVTVSATPIDKFIAPGANLGDVINTASSLLATGKQVKAAEAKQAGLVEAGKASTSYEEASFNAARGDVDSVARAISGYTDTYGKDLNPQQQAALGDYQKQLDRLQKAQARGGNAELLSLTQEQLRTQFSVKHPELNQTFQEMAGRIDTNQKDDRERLFAFDKAHQEAQIAAEKKHIELMDSVNTGSTNVSTMSRADAQNKWQTDFAPIYGKIQQSTVALDAAEKEGKLNDLQWKQFKDNTINGVLPELQSALAISWGNANKQLPPNATPQERAAVLQKVLDDAQTNSRQQFHINTQEEFDSRMGFFINPLKSMVQEIATGKMDADAVQNQVTKIYGMGKLDLAKRFPGATLYAAVDSSLGKFAIGGMNTNDGQIAVNNVMHALVDATHPKVDTTQPVGTRSVVPTFNQSEAQTVKQAQTVAQTVSAFQASPPTQRTPAENRAATDAVVSYLNDPTTSSMSQVTNTILPIMADDNFLKMSKDHPISAKTQTSLMDYSKRINRATDNLVSSLGDNFVATANPDGTVTYSTKTPVSAQTQASIKFAEKQTNLVIRAYAHSYGSDDYAGAYTGMMEYYISQQKK